MKQIYYAAYGSNLNLRQMARRCPTAKVVGAGQLTGYQLLFRGPDGGAVATVERHKGGCVPALIWSIALNTLIVIDISSVLQELR